MGKGKLRKFAEYESFANTFDTSCTLKGKWNDLFFKNKNPIVLELACGRGEYSVGLAQLNPNKNFIGIDVKGARMWKGAKFAIENKMQNVAFLRIQIDHLENYFSENEISEAWIVFADPQPQKAKKRLTSLKFIEIYRKLMPKGAPIHLKTDSDLLYQSTIESIEQFHLTTEEKIDNIYANNSLSKELSIQTYYEKMWLKEGRTIKYIRFKL